MPAIGSLDAEIIIALRAGHLADGPVHRAIRIRTTAPSTPIDATLLAAWNALDISSGVARLSAAVSEAFVPQMLNYESVGGVNFKKGCYPGQEVVARSQFRGTLKRRAFIATSDQAVQAGQEVFDRRDGGEPDQPCGQIAQASKHPEGGFIAIVSMQIPAQSSPALHAGEPTGPRLQLQALPYELLADV